MPLAGVRRGDHNRAGDQTQRIQMFLIRHGGQFAVGRKLTFHANRDMGAEMPADIAGDQRDTAVGLIDLPFLRKLFLEVGLLPLGQFLR